MESKIIQVINKMIENSHLIKEVTKGSQSKAEYFFVYDQKYKWSIMQNEYSPANYLLYYYQESLPIAVLAGTPSEIFNFVSYNSADLKSQEAEESFAELYNVVKEKLLGMDHILDEILSDEPLEG